MAARMKARRLMLPIVALVALAEALIPPGPLTQPVLGASARDWNPRTLWRAPWGASGVHKGIDIFARHGETVMAAQSGLVLWRGSLAQGGKAILVVTPRGWLHYYAHLSRIQTRPGAWVVPGEPIGEVGDTGNAKGKSPHLHYAVLTLAPRPWEATLETQGWKRMFYRNPGLLLE